MTVGELIKALEALPQDLPVYIPDWNEDWRARAPQLVCDVVREGPRQEGDGRDPISLPDRVEIVP